MEENVPSFWWIKFAAVAWFVGGVAYLCKLVGPHGDDTLVLACLQMGLGLLAWEFASVKRHLFVATQCILQLNDDFKDDIRRS
jgi:hypothetical protein